jgi:hypothetical protein
MRGALNVSALQRALQEIVARHEVLRTRYAARSGNPVQIVAPDAVIEVPLLDLSALPGMEREEKVRQIGQEEATRPFDVAVGPMVRARLLRLAAQEHVLFLTLHHIASDGWSNAIFMRELSSLYSAFCKGQPSPLLPLPIQYADYAAWQREWLTGEALNRQVSYWRDQLAGAPPLLELPTDHPREQAESYGGALEAFTFPPEVQEGLRKLCREARATPFMVVLAAMKVLLYRWTGQPDLVVGTDVANRSQPQTERLIGFFLNHLVLRTRLSGDPSFREVVGRVREVCLGAYAHQDLPFDKLVEVLQPERSMSHTPVFQVLCVVHNVPPSTLQLLGLELESVDSVLPASKFDLSLFVGERDGKMEGQWVYRTDLFEASTIRRLAGQYLGVLNQVLQQPDRAIEDVELLSESTSGEEQASDRSGTTGIRDARRKAAIVVSGSEGAD